MENTLSSRIGSLGAALSLIAAGCKQEADPPPAIRPIGASELNKLNPVPLLEKTVCVTGDVVLIKRDIVISRSGKYSFCARAKSHYLVTQTEDGKTNVIPVEHDWISSSRSSVQMAALEEETRQFTFHTNDPITGTWTLVPGTRNFYLYSCDNIAGLGRYDNKQLFSMRINAPAK